VKKIFLGVLKEIFKNILCKSNKNRNHKALARQNSPLTPRFSPKNAP
jgi:hypothetical protein